MRCESRDGRRFASLAERDRYEELLLLQRAGDIAGLECQPAWTFPIAGPAGTHELRIGARAVRFTADFRYRDLRRGGLTVVEDAKGVMTRDAVLRIALMQAVHGIEVVLVRAPSARAPRRR